MNDKAFRLNETEKIKYYTIPKFEDTNLVNHAFTTRDLNLGFNTIDSDSNILNNYKIISAELGSSVENSVLSDQTHKTDIRMVTNKDRGKGLIKEKDYTDVDGLVTDEKGITLFTVYADCVPLFFLDPVKEVAGVAHAGWKGTVGKIGENMISIMKENYGSKTEDILVGIGPSIGECCYEVNKDVFDKFDKNFNDLTDIMTAKENCKWDLDLWKANETVMIESGIPSENITVSGLCTSCNNDMFFSYRKEDGKTGRISAAIVLKE